MNPTPEQIRTSCPQGSASFLRLNGLTPMFAGFDVATKPDVTVTTIVKGGKKLVRVSKPKQSREQKKAASSLQFLAMCEAYGLPTPKPEYRFHDSRMWRFDWAWIPQKVALEIDGGLFINGGHNRGAQREKDYEKDAAALILGWRVLRASTGQVKRGEALRWLKDILRISIDACE